MKLVDLNVLLYAVNRDAAQHARVATWWDAAVNGEETVGLAWAVLLGFVRLSTNPSVFAQPLPPADAIERVDAWLSHANIRVVQETEEHWTILRGLLDSHAHLTLLSTDAHLAALAISHGATLVSCDADFARFEKLRWENPAIG